MYKDQTNTHAFERCAAFQQYKTDGAESLLFIFVGFSMMEICVLMEEHEGFALMSNGL